MSKISQIEVELTEEEATRLRAVMESGDEAAMLAEIKKLDKAANLRQHAQDLRLRLLTDVVRCAHHFMHAEDNEKACALLCATVALIDGESVPLEVLESLFTMLNENRIERAKADCGGSA